MRDRRTGTCRSVRRGMVGTCTAGTLLALLAATAPATAQMPAANLDQIRNGAFNSPINPPNWVNGNAGEQNAHFAEGMSISYRCVMTNLPVGQVITLVMEFDAKHSGAHAIDYLTNFQRLEPHAGFLHPAETVDPRIGVPAVAGSPITGDDTALIPQPVGINSPVAGQPAQSYQDVLAAEGAAALEMALYNGAFMGANPIVYGPPANLAMNQAAQQIEVTFMALNPTVVLAWGGHIASRNDWGFNANGMPRSAGGISGSPYHMRLIDWNLNNLGNQDRSLKAAAVFFPCPCEVTGPTEVCPFSGGVVYSGPPDDGMTTYLWEVVGDGNIVGPNDQPTVTVEPKGVCGGSYTVILTSTCGFGGLPTTCELPVDTVDNDPPTIMCPPDVTLECPADTDPANTGVATCDDSCGGCSVDFSDDFVAGCGNTGVITRTWTATDDCGNTASCVQIITIVDTTPPTITCPPDVTLECPADTDPSNTGMAICDDTCGGCTVDFTDQVTPGCGNTQTILRTWTATDDCGNFDSCTQTITVVDTTPPDITCPGPLNFQCVDQVPPCDPNDATASDTCGGVTVVCLPDSDNGGSGCPSDPLIITRTYQATDDCGNTATCTQTITVADTMAPMIMCPPDVTLECPADTDPSNTGVATCTDNCGGCMVNFSDSVIPGCGLTETIMRTWTATDDCGNSSSCVQVISVVDTTPPDITCPGPLSFQCPSDVPPCNPNDASASDTCGGVTIDCLPDTDNGGSGCPGDPLIITRTYQATDDCGNTAICTQTITVVDDTDPEITCPGPLSFQCLADVPPCDPNDATATDNCGDVTVTCLADTDNGGTGCPGDPLIITRTYQATDACGNTATCTQEITVVDDTPPTITSCPGDAAIDCNVPFQFNVGAEDNCRDATVTCTFTADNPGNVILTDLGGGRFTIEFTGSATATITCVATDDCGNVSDECVFTVSADCGAEGCTPGFWKQPQHFQFWPAPYTPGTLFSDVFDNAFPGKTLLQVLSQPGSTPPGPEQLNALGRHTVAALLNAASSGVSFGLTPQDVIDMFNDVYPGNIGQYTSLKNFFAGLNMQGCPLGGPVVNLADSGGTGQASGGAPLPDTDDGLTDPAATLPPVDSSPDTNSDGPAGNDLSPTDSGPDADETPADQEKGDESEPLSDGPGSEPQVLRNDSLLSPADNGGLIVAPGDFVQGPMGVLQLEIGGLLPVLFHDMLDVKGAAALDGVLVVEFTDGFVPRIGDEFAVLKAGTLSGAFHSVVTPDVGADAKLEVVYGPASVILRTVAKAAPGDVDLDGTVGYHDLLALLGAFGQVNAAYDLDDDGIVGVSDLAILLEQWSP